MASGASEALGSKELAGTLVNPMGMTRKMTASTAAGIVGGAAGRMSVPLRQGSEYAGAPDVPNFGRVGYVAASGDEIALVKTKSGLMKMKVTDEVLARAPRSEIQSVELEKGWLSQLKIAFTNGVLWEFDVPKVNQTTAEKLVEALGGQIT